MTETGPVTWEGHACGLRIVADVELFPTSVGKPPNHRRLEVRRSRRPIQLPTDEREAAVVEGDAGEELVAVIESDEGTLLDAPGIARILISTDGTEVSYVAEYASGRAWKRLIVDQALPIAATIQGLETMHASSVSVGGKTLAMAGPSGVGKSSLLGRLVNAGGTPISDDVIAMERIDDRVYVHPGPSWVSLRPAELDALHRAGLGDKSRLVSGKLTDEVTGLGDSTPLAALLLLERDKAVTAVEVLATRPDPGELLALSFNFLDDSPERLLRMLDVFSCLAASARVLRVRSPLHGDAGTTAAAILAAVDS